MNTPQQVGNHPIVGHVFTRFPHAALEAAYREHLAASHRTLTTVSLVLAALLFAVAEPLARTVFPSEITTLDNAVRWYLNLPIVLLALVAHLKASEPPQRELALLTALALMFAGNAVLLWSAPTDGQLYYAVAAVQIALFGFFLLGLRFGPTCIVVAACFATPAAGALLRALASDPSALLHSAYAAALLIAGGLAFAAGALDRSRRELFLANIAREREHTQRLALEQERSRWLRVSSDYLNHEMKNALLGISSSLNLLQRGNHDRKVDEYIERAASSTRFMKRLLAQVSASTSLEAALGEIKTEVIDLAEVLGNRLAEYRAMHPHHTFEASIPAHLVIACDLDRLIQALDKLVDNAAQHSAQGHPIRIELEQESGAAVVRIANRGDALLDASTDIFAAHVSGRQRTDDGGFGLGLYIVQRIAEAHGGSVSSRALSDPDGAQFTLRLPLTGS